MFSFLARWWFRSPLHDVLLRGLRDFQKSMLLAYSINVGTGKVALATEMIIKDAQSSTEQKLLRSQLRLIPMGERIALLIFGLSATAKEPYDFSFLMCSPRVGCFWCRSIVLIPSRYRRIR